MLTLAMHFAGNPMLVSINSALASFAGHHLEGLKWKVEEVEGLDGGIGRIAFAVIGGNKSTGEIHVLAALENAAAPHHKHGPPSLGNQYGELIISIAGELEDEDDATKPVMLGPGMHLVHAPGTHHRPRAPRFALVYYHQPHGSKLM